MYLSTFFHKLMLFAAITLIYSTSANAWTVARDFNSGVAGQKAQGTSGFSSAKDKTLFTTEKSYEGGKAAKLTISKNSFGSKEFGGVIVFPKKLGPGDELWYRVRVYSPIGFSYADAGLNTSYAIKFMRVHTETSIGDNVGYIDLYVNGNTTLHHRNEVKIPVKPYKEPFSAQTENPALNNSEKVTLGKWNTFEVYVKFGDPGVYRVWKDGKLLYEKKSWVTLKRPTDRSDRVHLYTYWNGASTQTQTSYADDIIITNERPAIKDSYGNYMIGVGKISKSNTPVVADPSPPNQDPIK